jgi:hypothetical protein
MLTAVSTVIAARTIPPAIAIIRASAYMMPEIVSMILPARNLLAAVAPSIGTGSF